MYTYKLHPLGVSKARREKGYSNPGYHRAANHHCSNQGGANPGSIPIPWDPQTGKIPEVVTGTSQKLLLRNSYLTTSTSRWQVPKAQSSRTLPLSRLATCLGIRPTTPGRLYVTVIAPLGVRTDYRA